MAVSLHTSGLLWACYPFMGIL